MCFCVVDFNNHPPPPPPPLEPDHHSGANSGRGMRQIYSPALHRMAVWTLFLLSPVAAALWVARGNIWRGQ